MRFTLLAVCCAALLSLPSCSGDTHDPSFADIWPHEDGLTWLFDYSVESYDDFSFQVFDTEDDIPHIPPMAVLAAYLDSAIPEAGDLRSGYYELSFDGMMTTDSGAEGQRLVESIYDRSFEYPLSPHAGAAKNDQFMRSLALARPDLRPAIRKARPHLDLSPTHENLDPPLLLAGGAWTQTADWIGNYGDADEFLAWKYLSRDIKPGAAFRHQLIPLLADDVFLDVEVLDWVDVETAIGDFKKCVEVLYRVDYGVTVLAGPEEQSYSRLMGYGILLYAPGIGPIYGFERDLCNLLDPFDCARETESLIVSHIVR